jgi:hypothetical protein
MQPAKNKGFIYQQKKYQTEIINIKKIAGYKHIKI